MPPEHVAIVIPVFRNAETLRALHNRICDALAHVNAVPHFVFVEDAGGDASLGLLKEMSQSDPRVTLITNQHNLGQQASIRKALEFVGDRDVVVMDADLQDPPEAIPMLLETLWSSGADAVFAARVGAYQSGFRMATSKLYRSLMSRFASIPPGAGGFVALRANLAKRLAASRNSRFHLAGMIGCHAGLLKAVSVERNYRQVGNSAYSQRMRLVVALSNFVCVLEERFRRGAL
ncbi:Undecaprenyl-phosphate 4-deoxy-4-formamido-L-arabinose transferase [Shimia sp. SK013]|uniref:glycosyltransferase n=1 Tax=Shimia sp. SK013 TaxID=1389006 RepID=UPI0006B5B0B0|nr:glycosyltransferase [Shimia sp. SK013]KPA21408.1 Undecaprenyl-phosphate 4-deoxy-4-formamido-L-arabinose transferase [Shimia sp. SK013]